MERSNGRNQNYPKRCATVLTDHWRSTSCASVGCWTCWSGAQFHQPGCGGRLSSKGSHSPGGFITLSRSLDSDFKVCGVSGVVAPTGTWLCACLGRGLGEETSFPPGGSSCNRWGLLLEKGLQVLQGAASHLLDSCVLASPLILLSEVIRVLVLTEVCGMGRRAGPFAGTLQEEA